MSDLPTQADFDAMYTGTPPWDIGRPQSSLRAVAEAGGVRGRVLDAGCGTGEHALMAAAMGLDATGVDGSPRAIGLARRKAAERGIDVRFLLADALDLGSLGEVFDTVIDSGLFHVFGDDDRARYVDSLRAATAPGGRLYVLCFSDRFPPGLGPRRISQHEILASFSDRWTVEAIEGVGLESTLSPDPIPAWLATIERPGEQAGERPGEQAGERRGNEEGLADGLAGFDGPVGIGRPGKGERVHCPARALTGGPTSGDGRGPRRSPKKP